MDQIHMKTKSEFCVLKIKCKITMMKTTKLSVYTIVLEGSSLLASTSITFILHKFKYYFR